MTKEESQKVPKDQWLDISGETYREYVYPDGSVVHVDAPLELRVSASSLGGHSHRVKTIDTAYFVAPGWNAIRWQVKPGTPLFSF